MNFSLSGAAGQPNFRPKRDIRARDKGRFGIESSSPSSSAPQPKVSTAGQGLPAWAYPALAYCAATPVYCQWNSRKLIEQGWANQFAKEALAAGQSTSAPLADLVLVETFKENAQGVPERVMVLVPSNAMLEAERERNWAKPAVKTAVSVGVGLAVIGAAAYFDKLNKDKASKK